MRKESPRRLPWVFNILCCATCLLASVAAQDIANDDDELILLVSVVVDTSSEYGGIDPNLLILKGFFEHELTKLSKVEVVGPEETGIISVKAIAAKILDGLYAVSIVTILHFPESSSGSGKQLDLERVVHHAVFVRQVSDFERLAREYISDLDSQFLSQFEE